MTFAHPVVLWLLLVFPPGLAAFFWWSWRTRRRLLTQFIQARLLPGLTVGISNRRLAVRLVCLLLGVILAIVALARPQWGFDWQEVKQRGVDIVVAIDTSKSMLAEDIAPNRLERAKFAARELMQRARADRLGLVAFAGGAFLQCPLTIDDAAFEQSVAALDVNVIPQGGTALAEAIEVAQTAFKEGENFKVLVMFTDGEDQDSGAVEAAQKAGAEGLQIFTIGIGSTDGDLLRIKDGKGRTDFIRDEQGNVVKSRLDEKLLRQIASQTSAGFYLPLIGAKAIDTLYEKGIAPLPKTESKEALVRHYHERFQWPLGLSIIFLIAEMLFPERKRESGRARSGSKSAGLSQVAAVVLVLASIGNAAGSPGRALREYQAGKYDQALKDYEELLKHHADDPRLHFNAGAAAYRNRQFDQAAKHFDASAASPDLKLQGLSYYNRGNALYRLGDAEKDQARKMETWKRAVQDYEYTLKLAPEDADAKFNLEFVKKKLEELNQQKQDQQEKIKPSEAAKKAKAEADEAVRRREYKQALDIMQKQLDQDPTTAYYNDYIERLKQINGITEAPHP
jgi:Ca-activated chloride channel family protein